MTVLNFNEEYVEKLANGDPEVERHFIAYFSNVLRLKLRVKIRSPQIGEDIRQETFYRVLKALRTKHALQAPEKLPAFVNSVCNHVSQEALRSATRHRQIPEDAPEAIDESADSMTRVVNSECKEIVRQLLSELPQKDSDLLRMVFLEELDKDLICSRMGVNPEYLRVLIHRAKNRFKAQWRQRDLFNGSHTDFTT